MRVFTKPERFELECDDYVQVMPIAAFLELAAPTEISQEAFEGDEDWDDYPYLIVDPESKQVFGHEGRHRLSALAFSGYTHAEVIIQIQPDTRRFNSDLEAMSDWEWNGVKPGVDELKPETEWLK